MSGVKMLDSDFGSLMLSIESIVCTLSLVLSGMITLAIVFLILLSYRVENKIDWNYFEVFTPIWVLDLITVYSIIYLNKHISQDDLDTCIRLDDEAEGESLTAAELLIVMKANNPAAITTWWIFVPYSVFEFFDFFINFAKRTVAYMMTPQSIDLPLYRAVLFLFAGFWGRVTRIAFAVLITLKIDNVIDWSWGIVFIPLYLPGFAYFKDLLNAFAAYSTMESLDARSQGQSLICIAGVFYVIGCTFVYSLIGLLAAKLDGYHLAVSQVLIPSIENNRDWTPENDTESPQVRLVSPEGSRSTYGTTSLGQASSSRSADDFYVVPHIVRSGETISSSSYTVSAGGKGANQSVALGRAGVNVYHAGKIGRDGEWILEIMRNAGVDTSYTKVSKSE
ncbi:hypothetical protein BGZ65_009350, partial [Modicella reniformis]